MKILASFILLVIFLLTTAHAQQITREQFDYQGRKRTYYLFVPDTTKTASNLSLIVLLHGSDRNGLSLVEKWKDLASTEGFIIVGPDSSSRSGWRTPEDGPEFLHELAELIRTKYQVDPKRVYLFGHSAGAVFALKLAILESEYFAAVAVHAGSLRSKEDLEIVSVAKRKIPIEIIVGDRDNFFSIESVKATEEAMKDHQIPITVVIMKGHDHWYYDLASDINQDAWNFLKQTALTQEPRHVQYNSVGTASDANAALSQIKALRFEAQKLNAQFDFKEKQIAASANDKVALSEIVKSQVLSMTDCAKVLREAAEVAERASQLKLTSQQQTYFSLVAAAGRKRAEAMDLIKTRAELLLTDEEPNSIIMKRSKLAEKANSLNDEATELELKAQQLLGR